MLSGGILKKKNKIVIMLSNLKTIQLLLKKIFSIFYSFDNICSERKKPVKRAFTVGGAPLRLDMYKKISLVLI